MTAAFQPLLVRVADASVLIVLAKIGRLDLLTMEEGVTVIAETVFQEVLAGRPSDPARRALIDGFGRRTPDVPIPSDIAARKLDAGEEATLALAQSAAKRSHTAVAVLDDNDGRGAARALGIAHTGTTGLILKGKRLGLVPSAAILLQQAAQQGLFLPPMSLLRAELNSVGEEWP